MASVNIAADCMADVLNKLSELPEVGNKTLYCYDYDILTDAAQELQYPCVGVVYEGMTSVGGNDRTGLSSNLVCGIFLLAGDKDTETRGVENKTDIVLLLDKLRRQIKNTTSPTRHRWEFVLEIPFDISNRSLGYYQKWKTNIILT